MIRLTHIDGKLPNLALMKFAAFFNERRVPFVFSRSLTRALFEPKYERVYGSAIFAWSKKRVDRLVAEFPDAIVGGTGAKGDATSNTFDARTVEEELDVEEFEAADYSIYPKYRFSLGFTQRGCRLRCKFCVVPQKEGRPRSVNTIAQIWRGDPHPRQVVLLDNDFFGQPEDEWQARIEELRDGKFQVSFNQGINVRLVTPEVAKALASVQYFDDQFKTRRLYTAWDNLKDERIFFRGVDLLEEAGVPSKHLLAYMLVNFDPEETLERLMYRFLRMRERQIVVYPMIYDRKHAPLWVRAFQGWVVGRRHQMMTFEDFYKGVERSNRFKRQRAMFGIDRTIARDPELARWDLDVKTRSASLKVLDGAPRTEA